MTKWQKFLHRIGSCPKQKAGYRNCQARNNGQECGFETKQV